MAAQCEAILTEHTLSLLLQSASPTEHHQERATLLFLMHPMNNIPSLPEFDFAETIHVHTRGRTHTHSIGEREGHQKWPGTEFVVKLVVKCGATLFHMHTH